MAFIATINHRNLFDPTGWRMMLPLSLQILTSASCDLDLWPPDPRS